MNLFFLKAKHWQLFLLMLLPVLISSVFLITETVSLVEQMIQKEKMVKEVLDYQGLTVAFVWMCLSGVFSYMVYLLWIWSVNVKLVLKLPISEREAISRFGIMFFLCILYILFYLFASFYVYRGFIMDSSEIQNLMDDYVYWESVMNTSKFIIPINLSLALLSFMASIYMALRTGRILKKIESKEKVNLGDYLLEALLVILFPIVGVWILQPRINKCERLPDWEENSDENLEIIEA